MKIYCRKCLNFLKIKLKNLILSDQEFAAIIIKTVSSPRPRVATNQYLKYFINQRISPLQNIVSFGEAVSDGRFCQATVNFF